MRRAVLLLALSLAAVARGQDAGDKVEPIAETHPLREMLTERFRIQQTMALQRVVDVNRALAHAAAVAYVDLDQDGVGELPALAEILGLAPWRGSDDPAAGVLGWGDAVLRDDGAVEASGYLYRVVLPDADLGPAASLGDVSPDAAERHAVVYAWPLRHGFSGRWTFGLRAPDGEPLATESAAYSGADAPPPADALLAADRGMDGALAAPGTPRDGNDWVSARDLVESLRESEPTLKGPEDPLWTAMRLPILRNAAWRAVFEDGGTEQRTLREEENVPPNTRLTSPAEIATAIAEELRYPMERTGQWERQKASFEIVGATTPAKYVARDNLILICPETFVLACHVVGIPPERMTDVFRLVVAHECVHSYQFQTYPLQEALHECRSEAAIAAWTAVVEGHAQQVTRRLAKRRNLAHAFEDMLLLTAPDAGDPSVPEEARGALSGLSFPYHDGERFMDAVLAARGDDGVADVLRTPPTRPMLIETPELWLARAPGAPPTDWDAITDPLRGFEPPAADVRRTPVLRRTLRQMLAAAPQLDADAIVSGVHDVESRVAVSPDGRVQAASTVLLCRDARAARAYVVASRALQAAQDAAYEQNPLVEPDVVYAAPPALDGVGAGYRVRKLLRSGASTVHGLALSVTAGRWVVEAAVTTLDEPEPALVRSLERAVGETLERLPDR